MASAALSKPVNWIKKKYNENRLIHAGVVMAVMGWVPLVWTPLMFSLAGYAAVKRKELNAFIILLKKSLSDFLVGSAEEKAEAKGERNKSFFWAHLGNWVNVSPLNTGKALFSIYILAISSMPWSMFMIYALYRPRTEIIQAIYAQSKVTAKALLSFYKSLTNVKKVFFTLAGISLISGMLNVIIAYEGLLGVFDVAATIAMLGLTVAGVRLGGQDFFGALSDPIKLVTNKMGIFLGMIGGNRLAHTIFAGKISGSFGPVYGGVQSSGLFPSLYGMFFSTNPYGHSKVLFGKSLFGSLFHRMSTGIGGLLGSIFFSHDVTMHGAFYGVLGPTSYQLFACMAMGALVGYFIDKAVDRVSKMIKADAIKIWENNSNSPTYSKSVVRLKSGLNLANLYRLPVTMTLIATGLFAGLRMPLYMSLLHTTASPLLSILGIEAGLLLVVLPATKLYRMVNMQYQKYFGEKPKQNINVNLNLDLDLEAALKAEREIVIERREIDLNQALSPEEVEAQWLKAQIEDYQNANQPTNPDFTTLRSNVKRRKAVLPQLLEAIEEVEHEHESGLEIDALEKSLNQSWSFQDKEPVVQALLQRPQPVSFVFHPHRSIAVVTPNSVVGEQPAPDSSIPSASEKGKSASQSTKKEPKLPAGINVENIIPNNVPRRKTV